MWLFMWEEEIPPAERGRQPATGPNPAGKVPTLTSPQPLAESCSWRCDFLELSSRQRGCILGPGKWPQGEVQVGREGSPAARRAALPVRWGRVCVVVTGQGKQGEAAVISSMSHLRRVPGPPTEPVVNSPLGGWVVTHEEACLCRLGLGEAC